MPGGRLSPGARGIPGKGHALNAGGGARNNGAPIDRPGGDIAASVKRSRKPCGHTRRVTPWVAVFTSIRTRFHFTLILPVRVPGGFAAIPLSREGARPHGIEGHHQWPRREPLDQRGARELAGASVGCSILPSDVVSTGRSEPVGLLGVGSAPKLLGLLCAGAKAASLPGCLPDPRPADA